MLSIKYAPDSVGFSDDKKHSQLTNKDNLSSAVMVNNSTTN